MEVHVRRWVAILPATAVAVGSYLRCRVARMKPAFVTPPADSMGP
jgi:hypothetical protein